ncbi:hypothetical protein [Candidatus Mesenet endosymbiont of Agriotes lineatus]|uniref:hypothetical protein n=1 Tax=Candidatus Mesenet endosymbiont of Agriotes lineatus TaxID=3077948 RepID=UPI0030D5854E
MLHNGTTSIEGILKDCEEFFDCVKEQPQEVKSFTYNVINKGALSLKYSMSGMSYLAFAASYATYFASYVPYGTSYAADFAAGVSSCASSCLDRGEKGYEQNIIDQGILGLKYGMDSVTYTIRSASYVLRDVSHTMCSASYILDSTSKALYNKSPALNKDNIDYVCTTADKYVDSFSNNVGTMLNLANNSIQNILPSIPMVI